MGVGLVILLILYFSGNYYLRESFDTRMELTPSGQSAGSIQAPDRPFATQPIKGLDDYETSAVFQNEGSREAGQREISDAMSRYPLSWTARPPSDANFQDYREAFIDASEKTMTDAPSMEQYKAISGEVIPDTSAADMEEQQMLAMYSPDRQQPLKEYNVNNSFENVNDLIKRIYDKKGLRADVERSKQGPNVFEIVETRPIDEKIIWEDEVERDPVIRSELRNEEQITVPITVSDIAAGLDPFFEPRTRTRMDRHDYTRWTPGLERQFAPTYAKDSWY